MADLTDMFYPIPQTESIENWDTTKATNLTALGKNVRKRTSSRQTILTT